MIEFVHRRGLVSANDDGNGLKRKEEEEEDGKRRARPCTIAPPMER